MNRCGSQPECVPHARLIREFCPPELLDGFIIIRVFAVSRRFQNCRQSLIRRFCDKFLIITPSYNNLVTSRFFAFHPVPDGAAYMLRYTLMALLTASAVATSLHAGESAPDAWSFVAGRDEIAPRASVRKDEASFGLVMSGNGEAIVDGKWVK